MKCPNCKEKMGMLAHGKCEKCGKYCGCSFDPTSKNDYCNYHRRSLSLTSETMELREKNGGWISVKERLPEDGQLVLIFSHTVSPAKYRKDENEFGRYPNHTPQDRALHYYFDNVTHWQPLPTPPSEDK